MCYRQIFIKHCRFKGWEAADISQEKVEQAGENTKHPNILFGRYKKQRKDENSFFSMAVWPVSEGLCRLHYKMMWRSRSFVVTMMWPT